MTTVDQIKLGWPLKIFPLTFAESFYLLDCVQLQNNSVEKNLFFFFNEVSGGRLQQNENKKDTFAVRAHAGEADRPLPTATCVYLSPVFWFRALELFVQRNVRAVCVVSGQVLLIWDGLPYLSLQRPMLWEVQSRSRFNFRLQKRPPPPSVTLTHSHLEASQ